MPQIPAVISLFVCEQVIIEETTRNVTPVNCFSHRVVKQFPYESVPFSVFAILNDGNGEIRLTAKIFRLDNWDTIYERSVSARFADQLQEIRCIFRIRDCIFPVPGSYEASLFANQELIAQRRFRVTN